MPGVLQRPAHVIREVRAARAGARRRSPRRPSSRPCGGPVRRLAAGLLEHPAPDRHDQPALLGQRDELVRGDDAARRGGASGSAPPRPRPWRGEVEDRLVEQEELVRCRAPRRGRSRAPGVLRRPRTCWRRTAHSGPCRRPWPRTAPGRRRAAARRGWRIGPIATPMLAVTEKILRPSSSSDRLAQHLGEPVGEQVQRRSSSVASRPARRTRRRRADRPCPASRTALCSRSPTVFSSWSPAAWPRLSLTCLKPSMSMNSAPASIPGSRRATREQLLGAVEHQRAVGQARERVVQSLVGELTGLLDHQRERPPASRASSSISSADIQQLSSVPPISTESAFRSLRSRSPRPAQTRWTVQPLWRLMVVRWALAGACPPEKDARVRRRSRSGS